MRQLPDRARRLVLLSGLLGWLAAGGAGAATIVVGSGKMVEGSGNVVDDVRNVAGYTRIVVGGPLDVVLTHSGSEKAVVRADDNIAPLIETRVDKGTLFVGARKDVSFRTRSRLSVAVDFRQLDSLLLRGSGDASVDDVKGAIFEGTIQGAGNMKIGHLDAETVAVSIAGSGNFSARGRAGTVGVVIKGSGDVRVEELEATTAAVRISGSGDVHVFATTSLQARIAGSGDVRYRGSPQVDKQIAGSGDVRPLR